MELVKKITGKKKPLSSFIAKATLPKGGVLLIIMVNVLHFVNKILHFVQCSKVLLYVVEATKSKEFKHGSA